jgi:hypothetical protein
MSSSLVAIIAAVGFLAGLVVALAWPARTRGLLTRAARVGRHVEKGEQEIRSVERPLLTVAK